MKQLVGKEVIENIRIVTSNKYSFKTIKSDTTECLYIQIPDAIRKKMNIKLSNSKEYKIIIVKKDQVE
jgi:hypothetical protein